jgi:hypothetical protein
MQMRTREQNDHDNIIADHCGSLKLNTTSREPRGIQHPASIQEYPEFRIP